MKKNIYIVSLCFAFSLGSLFAFIPEEVNAGPVKVTKSCSTSSGPSSGNPGTYRYCNTCGTTTGNHSHDSSCKTASQL